MPCPTSARPSPESRRPQRLGPTPGKWWRLARRALAAALGCLALAAFPCRADTAAPEADADEALYRAALVDIANGQTERAIAKLNTLADRAPYHLGALLDLAIAYCQSDDQTRAEGIFSRLDTLPQLPPAIGELITYYRSGNCQPAALPWRGFVAVGAGRASNLNQAPGSENFFLAPLGITVSLTDRARPRNDSYRLVEAGASRPAGENGWGGGVFFQSMDYGQANDFDTQLGQAHLTRRLRVDGLRLEFLGMASHLTLGGHSYLTALSGVASAMVPISETGEWQSGAVASLSDLHYMSLPDYRSRIGEVRGRVQWQPSPRFRLLGEAGLTHDEALADRPGGSRQGPVLQATAQWAVAPGHIVEVYHRHAWLKDAQPYSPGFFGQVRREPNQETWYAAWRYKFADNLQLRLEARRNTNRDSISLFDYHAKSANLMLEWSLP